MPTRQDAQSTPALRISASPETPWVTLKQGSVYENEIPPYIEAEMECLYENFFSSLARFKVYGGKTGISVFVAKHGNRIAAILAFRRSGNRIIVLNEQIEIDAHEINQFSATMFARYRDVSSIFFKATKTATRRLAYPHHALYFTNDVVLALPDSAQAYLAMLGKSTRENLRRYLKILQRDFPSFAFAAHDKAEQCAAHFHRIIDFNRARMAEKGKISGVTREEAGRLWELVKVYGLVSTITIDGQVRAGTICYRIGTHYFMRISAHDSAFSTYSLGILASYLTICECIQRGGKEFHFLWGREEYKFRLLGKHRHFDSLTIYRSRSAFLLQGAAILQSLVKDRIRQTKQWILDPANQDRALARYARRVHDTFRMLRAQ